MRQTITYLGHRWKISKEPSTLGNEYVILERTHWLADLRRYGQVTSAIDASKKDIQRITGIIL